MNAFKLIFLILTVGSVCWSQDQSLQKVAPDLFKQKIIRFYFETAPGMGHQSHTALLVRRLREEGYKGQLEILFNPESREKIATLFPTYELRLKSKDQIDKKNNLRFLELKNWYIQYNTEDWEKASRHYKHTKYVISGGHDARELNPDILSKVYKGENLLVINPQGWEAPQSFILKSNGERISFSELTELGTRPSSWLWTESELDRTLIKQLEFIQKNSFMIPFYVNEYLWEERLTTLIKALEPVAQGRTITIVTFNKISPFLQNVFNSNWQEPNTIEKGEINLVHVGRVSQPTFTHVFSQMKVPLAVVAGKNSTHLAALSGRPFLEGKGHYQSNYGHLAAASPYYTNYDMANIAFNNNQRLTELSIFLSNLLQRHSGTLRLFELLKESTVDANKIDKAEEAFKQMLRVIPAEGKTAQCRQIFAG